MGGLRGDFSFRIPSLKNFASVYPALPEKGGDHFFAFFIQIDSVRFAAKTLLLGNGGMAALR
jgi:hypothetical protein